MGPRLASMARWQSRLGATAVPIGAARSPRRWRSVAGCRAATAFQGSLRGPGAHAGGRRRDLLGCDWPTRRRLGWDAPPQIIGGPRAMPTLCGGRLRPVALQFRSERPARLWLEARSPLRLGIWEELGGRSSAPSRFLPADPHWVKPSIPAPAGTWPHGEAVVLPPQVSQLRERIAAGVSSRPISRPAASCAGGKRPDPVVRV